jgi:hypothetical protein
VTEDELHLLDTMTHDEQRQWAIDNAPPGAASGAVITAERLRSLPLAEMRAAVAARLAGDDAFGAFGKVARERGKAWPDEHYRQVAEVYKSAVEHREPPLKAIQERWHVTRPAAAKYVKGARERGFLGWPERAGLAGYQATESPFTSDSISAPSDRRTEWRFHNSSFRGPVPSQIAGRWRLCRLAQGVSRAIARGSRTVYTVPA